MEKRLVLGARPNSSVEVVKKMRERPQGPLRPPPVHMQISRQTMIEDAQHKLQMDIVNDYNFGIHGSQGVGKGFH